jgi:hypothetical protein
MRSHAGDGNDRLVGVDGSAVGSTATSPDVKDGGVARRAGQAEVKQLRRGACGASIEARPTSARVAGWCCRYECIRDSLESCSQSAVASRLLDELDETTSSR